MANWIDADTFLHASHLLVDQAIMLSDRSEAATLLFAATLKALRLDMDDQAAIGMARTWAQTLAFADDAGG